MPNKSTNKDTNTSADAFLETDNYSTTQDNTKGGSSNMVKKGLETDQYPQSVETTADQ